jgi:VanZ family protein
MAAIFSVSGISDLSVPSGTTDKSWHFLEYGGLALLVCRALAGGFGRRLPAKHLIAAVVICAAYALTDEFHQRFVPGRYSDWSDVAADAIGASAGAIAAWAWGIIALRARTRDGRERR